MTTEFFMNVSRNLTEKQLTSAYGFNKQVYTIIFSVISMGCGDGQAMNRCTSMTLGGAEVTICTCDQSLCNKSGNLILDSKLFYFILFLISIAYRIM